MELCQLNVLSKTTDTTFGLYRKQGGQVWEIKQYGSMERL